MHSSNRSLLWVRMAGGAVAVAALFFLVRRVQPGALMAALREMQPLWFLAAVGMFGLVFIPAAWRWHIALRLSGSALNFGGTVRFSIIGHFFYVILFGAVGGDAAKSALYSRAHRLPLANILVAASLDRLLGFAGLVLFGTAAFGIAASHGAFSTLEQFKIQWPKYWVWVVTALVLAALVVLSRARRGSVWERFTTAFAKDGRKLITSPRNFGTGILCGFMVQLALSATFALNLEAVSSGALPWGKLIWTFPVISIVSALPISIAGLGVRETAAFVLLGMCGVSGREALAASLLTAGVNLLWAVIGGVVLAREMRLRKAGAANNPVPPLIVETK